MGKEKVGDWLRDNGFFEEIVTLFSGKQCIILFFDYDCYFQQIKRWMAWQLLKHFRLIPAPIA